MSTANNNTDVAIIDQKKDLEHLNEIVTEINTLKEGYKDLKIEGPEDKDGYEQVRAAIGVLRPKRTGLEAERKSVVKPYNDFVKHINSEYEKITDLIQSGPGGELELKKKKEEIDDIIERQKEEKRLAEEKKINDRINELLNNGMAFDGEYYSIKALDLGITETSIGVVDIRTMSDDLFTNFLEMVKDKNAKIVYEKELRAEKERSEKEQKDKEEKAAREEFEKQQAILKEQQEKLEKEKMELQQQKDDMEKQKREQEQEKVNSIIRHRGAVLTGMGLLYNSNNDSYDYEKEVIISDASTIHEHGDTAWLELIETVKTTIADKKEEAERFLKQQQEQEQERLRLQELERQDGLSDRQKMNEYIDALLAIPVPELKTKVWRKAAGGIRDYITDNRPAVK